MAASESMNSNTYCEFCPAVEEKILLQLYSNPSVEEGSLKVGHEPAVVPYDSPFYSPLCIPGERIQVHTVVVEHGLGSCCKMPLESKKRTTRKGEK